MKTTQIFDIGSSVICDICGEDYTDSEEPGGFIFTSSAYCPKCSVEGMEAIKKYAEERFIKAKCPKDQSFADFVKEYRNGNNTITITEIVMNKVKL